MANSADPDQMPHSAVSDLVYTVCKCLLFANAYLFQYLGLLRYSKNISFVICIKIHIMAFHNKCLDKLIAIHAYLESGEYTGPKRVSSIVFSLWAFAFY